jgi:hypothetical protein
MVYFLIFVWGIETIRRKNFTPARCDDEKIEANDTEELRVTTARAAMQ